MILYIYSVSVRTDSKKNVEKQIPLIFQSSKSFWHQKKFSNKTAIIRLGSLFSGIGAIEHAIKRSGLKSEIIFACDNDPACKKTYMANHQVSENHWYDDVTTLNASKYKYKVDLLVGGSPCQSFSMVGNRMGLKDTRGTLFYDFARVIDETRPKVFIFENVRGITSHDQGKTWKVIKKVFEELGYRIYFDILNSRDFGIPQNRQRFFVVGFRDKKELFQFPSPIELKTTMQDFLEDFIDSKYFLKRKGIKFVTSSKNREKRYTQINGEVALCQKANQQFNWHGDFIFESLDQSVNYDEFIFNVNEVEEKYYLSKTVKNYVLQSGTKNFKTSIGTDLSVARPLLQTMHKMHRSGVDNYVTHNKGRIRKLTPRECLRLMGFRDSFKIVVPDTQLYRQAGNSIVVDVLIAILKEMDISRFGQAN